MAKQRKKISGGLPLLLVALPFLLAGGWLAAPSLFAIVSEKEQIPALHQALTPESGTELQSQRGNIYDRSYAEMAVSFPLISVYAKPTELRIDEERLAILAALLKSDPEQLRRNLKSERSIVWLTRSLSPSTATELNRLHVPGIYLLSDQQRYYPQSETAAHLIGFFRDGHGLAGLEYGYDNILSGRSQASKKKVRSGEGEARRRQSLVLHLDLEVQRSLERGFRKIRERLGAEEIFGAVMEPSTGEVLALANIPAYDPNRFWDYSERDLQNRVADEPIDLGSLADLFRLASAAEHGKTGREREKAGLPLYDRNVWQTTEQGNIVSPDLAGIASYLPSDRKTEVEGRFFALAPSPVDLPKVRREKGGNNPEDVDRRITAMQLLSAFSSLVNGGVLHRPGFVRSVRDEDGTFHEAAQDEGMRSIGTQTSEWLRTLLLDENSGFCLLASMHQNGPAGTTVDSETELSERMPEKKAQADVVALAIRAAKNGDKVMVLVLRQSVMDGEQRDYLAKTVEKVLNKASVVSEKAPDANPGQFAEDVQEVYGKWQTVQETAANSGEQKGNGQKKIMPPVAGLSLRKALQVLGEMELQITVKGAGIVVRQDPPSGSELKKRQVFLLLRSEV